MAGRLNAWCGSTYKSGNIFRVEFRDLGRYCDGKINAFHEVLEEDMNTGHRRVQPLRRVNFQLVSARIKMFGLLEI